MARDERSEPTSDDVSDDGAEPSDELVKAGAVVEKAIEYLLGQGVPPVAVASALLGGSLGLLARTMDERAILRVLDNAATSVRQGELRARGEGDVPFGRA